jgi:hypothetical protein
MITQRFRPVAWVVGVAFAATALYTVSLRVANERAKLDDIDQQIAQTKRDIRLLQTELGTRGSLRQLERWNGEALSLVAPHASQFLNSEDGLGSIKGSELAHAQYQSAPVMVTADTAGAGQKADTKAGTMASNPDEQASTGVSKASGVALLEDGITSANEARQASDGSKSTKGSVARP